MNSKQPSRMLLLVSLFVLAGFWVFVMGFLVMMLGGGAGAAAPPKDPNLSVKIASLDRGKNFEISLALDIKDGEGKTMEGLGPQSIDVFEDGVPVVCHNFNEAGKGSIRLGLVMDATPTMYRGNKFQEAKNAARALMRLLRESDSLGLWLFNIELFQSNSTERVKIKPLDPVHRDLAWFTMYSAGTSARAGTPLLATITSALNSLTEVSGRKVMIVLTDGRDTDKDDYPDVYQKNLEELQAKCQQYRIPIYMVSPESAEDTKVEIMKEIATLTGGDYFTADLPNKLTEIFERIGRSLQDDYTLSYYSPNPVDDGTKRVVTVNVRTGRNGQQVVGDYSVAGMASTGGERSAAGGSRNVTLGTMVTIFVALSVALGLLSFVPGLRKHSGDSEAAAPAPPAAAPTAKAAPSPLRAGMPPPPPKRPKT